MNIFGFTFYIKIICCSKAYLRKSSLYHQILLQFLCVAWYLKRSNDTPKLNILKYNNYNIIEIFINRLSTTMQIFVAIDYLILMSEKYVHFGKRQMHVAKNFSPPSRSNWIHVLRKYFSNHVCLKDICKNLKEIGIIQVVSEAKIFVNL